MSKADEMFEKLGYKKDIDVNYGLIRYNKDDKYFIRFLIEDKAVEANSIIDNDIYVLSINMKLLNAINEKCRELGWIDYTTKRDLEYADNPITP